MWEAAAAAPAWVRPAFRTTIGFVLRHPFGGLGKGAAVLQVLEMLGDDPGVRILLEEGEQIVLVDVGFVAEADDRRDAHFGRARKADDRHADAAGLRRQRRRTLDVERRAERRRQVLRGVVEAVDVRPHQADVVCLADGDDLVLQFRLVGLGKARGNQHRARDLLLPALDQGAGHGLGGDRKHRDIDHARNVLDRFERRVAEDLVGLGVDRIDRRPCSRR